MNARKRKTR